LSSTIATIAFISALDSDIKSNERPNNLASNCSVVGLSGTPSVISFLSFPVLCGPGLSPECAGRYIREGWRLDEHDAARVVQYYRWAAAGQPMPDDDPEWEFVIRWAAKRGQSFIWIEFGDPVGMIVTGAREPDSMPLTPEAGAWKIPRLCAECVQAGFYCFDFGG
jgi:hypothetical protein